MSTRELQEKITASLKRWQKVEDATIASTADIIARSSNPVVCQVMRIIQADSHLHRQVQEMIVNSLEKEALALQPDDLEAVWDMIEKHIAMEKEAVAIVSELRDMMKEKTWVVQQYLLNYLLNDERKHNALLDELEEIKKGMYPYG